MKITFLLLCIVLAANMYAQDILWMRRFDLFQDETGYSIAEDSTGNIIIAGTYQRTASSLSDVLILKYDLQGNLIWHRRYDIDQIDTGIDLTTDASDNIIIACLYNNGSTEKPGLIKLSPFGETLWSRAYSELANVYLLGITLDSCNNIFACGINIYSPNAVIIKCDMNGNILWTRFYNWGIWQGFYEIVLDATSSLIVSGFLYDISGNSNLLLAKLNNTGDSIWTRRFNPGAQYVCGTHLTLDNTENIVVVGYAGDGQTFENGIVTKYSPEGTLLWNRNLNFRTINSATGVGTDIHCNIFVSGYCGTWDSTDYFLVKFSASGETLWTRFFDGGIDDMAGEIIIDRQNNPIITGSSFNSSNYDILTIKYRGSSGIEESVHNFNLINQDYKVKFATIKTRDGKINLEINRPDKYKIILYNSIGSIVKIIHQGYLYQGLHQFNLDRLQNGVYFLNIDNGKNKTSHKIVYTTR